MSEQTSHRKARILSKIATAVMAVLLAGISCASETQPPGEAPEAPPETAPEAAADTAPTTSAMEPVEAPEAPPETAPEAAADTAPTTSAMEAAAAPVEDTAVDDTDTTAPVEAPEPEEAPPAEPEPEPEEAPPAEPEPEPEPECADWPADGATWTEPVSSRRMFSIAPGVWVYELCLLGEPAARGDGVLVYIQRHGAERADGSNLWEHMPLIEWLLDETLDEWDGDFSVERHADRLSWSQQVTVVEASDFDPSTRNERRFPVAEDGTLGVYPEGDYMVNVSLYGFDGFRFRLRPAGIAPAEDAQAG